MKKTIRLSLSAICMLLMLSFNSYAESTISCPNCGKDLPGDVLFCPYCGTPLSEDDSEIKAVVSGSDEKGNLRIDFGEDGIVVYDNDYVTIRVVSFYEDTQNRIENVSDNDFERKKYVEKYMELKVHNNSEEEYIFDLDEGYVGDDSVEIIMETGNSGPAPGKNKTFQYRIESKGGANHVPLDDLRDLYDFECEVNLSIHSKEKNMIKDTNRGRVVFSEYLKNIQEENEETDETAEGSSMEQLAFETVLVNSKWVNENNGTAYIIFEKDGTGQFCNNIGLFDLRWKLDGNTISGDLILGDVTRKTSLVLQEEDGEFSIFYANDPKYVWYPTDK